jgi:hypothetical protein
MNFKDIFRKHMFSLILIFLILATLWNNIIGVNNTYGVNKTVGWAYDISNLGFWFATIFPLLNLLFLLGYLLIFILNRKTIFLSSILHYFLIIASVILVFLEFLPTSLILCFISIILFGFNIVKSYK